MTDSKPDPKGDRLAEIVGALLAGVQSISKTDTVVGEPQRAGDATVIPVHRVRIAFGAATASAGARGATVGGDSGGQGAGGAVELEPVAAIAVARDGSAHLLTVDGEERGAWSRLLEEAPDILGRLAEALGDRTRAEAALAPKAAPSPERPEK